MHLLDSTLVGEGYARGPAAPARAAVLVLGVGNLLMGDEGVGIHVLRALEEDTPLAGVRLLDGGTGGVNLLAEFDGVDAIVMIDATNDHRPPGTITYLRPDRVADLPRGLGAHDFGLKDLFAAAALVGSLPAIHLYTISIGRIEPMCTELTPAVAAAVSPVQRRVHEHARQLAAALAAVPCPA